MSFNPADLCGWVQDDRAVAESISSMAAMGVYDDSSSIKGHGLDQEYVALWEAENYVVGKMTPEKRTALGCVQLGGQWFLPEMNQTSGTCVSKATTGAQECNLMINIAFNHLNEEFQRLSSEAVYALARIQIGKGQLGNGAGAVAAWAALACQRYGVLPRGVYGAVDLRVENDKYADSWGAPGHGLPADLVKLAMLHPTKTITQATTMDQARSLMASWSALAVSSSQGFTQTRNEHGVCFPSGTWNHCMGWWGWAIGWDGNLYVFIKQSWRAANSPNGPSVFITKSGKHLQLPPGVFAAPGEVGEKMIIQGRDSWGSTGTKGFTRRIKSFGSAAA